MSERLHGKPLREARHQSRGYFGLALWHSKHGVNLGTAVRSAYAFGAAFVATVGKRYERYSSDVGKAWRHMPIFHFPDVPSLIAGLPVSCPLVAVELCDGATPLHQFLHPERAVYLLGPEDGSLDAATLNLCHRRIVIPGASWCLNVASAATVVLYARAVQQIKGGGMVRRPLYYIDPIDGQRPLVGSTPEGETPR